MNICCILPDMRAVCQQSDVPTLFEKHERHKKAPRARTARTCAWQVWIADTVVSGDSMFWTQWAYNLTLSRQRYDYVGRHGIFTILFSLRQNTYTNGEQVMSRNEDFCFDISKSHISSTTKQRLFFFSGTRFLSLIDKIKRNKSFGGNTSECNNRILLHSSPHNHKYKHHRS